MNIAVIGSGSVGRALATRFARAAVSVSLSSRTDSPAFSEFVRARSPYVTPTTVREGLGARIVVLAVPYASVRDLAHVASDWNDRIVIDATNAIDFPMFTPTDLAGRPSTEVVAETLRVRRVVKAFNTLPAALLGEDPAVGDGRRVLFVSGNDASANAEVSTLIDTLGFAPIDLGKLAVGGRLQEFGGPLAAKNLTQHAPAKH
jgi:predicted dinucleotide-binding enzyme